MSKHTLVSMVMVAALLVACGDEAQKTAAQSHRIALPVETVRTVAMPDIDSETGSVMADDRVDLSSRVAGFIRRLDVREGQRVGKGDVLIQIDPADVDEAIRQAQAGVAAAQVDLSDAERDLRAFTTGAGQGWVSADIMRKAQVRGDIARTNLAKAESALAGARAQQAYTSISSPVDGVVVARNKRKGDLATPGIPILTIESRNDLLFKLFVSESNVGRITPGMPAAVRIDALPGRDIPCAVQRIVPSGDMTTRRYEVDLTLPADPAILPGMFGRAAFALGSSSVVMIPRAALVERGGLKGVFVIDEGNIAHFRWLRLGREWDDRLEVTSGLAAGEKIVSQPNATVRDGLVIAAEGGKNG
jgi:RND family efflux transporter MFP subunit